MLRTNYNMKEARTANNIYTSAGAGIVSQAVSLYHTSASVDSELLQNPPPRHISTLWGI
jgi:hypothetical protein